MRDGRFATKGRGLISLVGEQGDLEVIRYDAGHAGPDFPGCVVESAAVSICSCAGHADADSVGARQSPREVSKMSDQLGITEKPQVRRARIDAHDGTVIGIRTQRQRACAAAFDAEEQWPGEFLGCHFEASIFGLAPIASSTGGQPVSGALASAFQFQRVRRYFNLMLHLQHEIEICHLRCREEVDR
jgi:hypothetical protein